MCYNPLAGGLLARVPDDDNEPSRFTGSVLADMYRKRYWSPEVLATVRRLAGIAEQSDLSLIELCLRWLLSQDVDRKSTRLNSSHAIISYAVFCLKKNKWIPLLVSPMTGI